jgi:hypothetical protein
MTKLVLVRCAARITAASTASSSPCAVCRVLCAVCLRCRWMGKGVSKAVDHLNKEIAPALVVSHSPQPEVKPHQHSSSTAMQRAQTHANSYAHHMCGHRL